MKHAMQTKFRTHGPDVAPQVRKVTETKAGVVPENRIPIFDHENRMRGSVGRKATEFHRCPFHRPAWIEARQEGRTRRLAKSPAERTKQSGSGAERKARAIAQDRKGECFQMKNHSDSREHIGEHLVTGGNPKGGIVEVHPAHIARALDSLTGATVPMARRMSAPGWDQARFARATQRFIRRDQEPQAGRRRARSRRARWPAREIRPSSFRPWRTRAQGKLCGERTG